MQDDEATARREYGLAVAKEVQAQCHEQCGCHESMDEPYLAAIVASVDLPKQQLLSAPTCDGWWWARNRASTKTREWCVVRLWRGTLYIASNTTSHRYFDAFVGPITPPAEVPVSVKREPCRCFMPHQRGWVDDCPLHGLAARGKQPPESAPTSEDEDVSGMVCCIHTEPRSLCDIAAADAAGYLRGEVAGLEKAVAVIEGAYPSRRAQDWPDEIASELSRLIRALLAAAQSKEPTP